MSKGLIGKKLGMTNLYSHNGRQIPVTVIEVGPCVVAQIKTVAKDGYNALQLAYGAKGPKNTARPMLGHLADSGLKGAALIAEVAVDDPNQYKPGQKIPADIFTVGEKVDVSGTTKGRGFAGVMKRHGFAGGRKTHGSHSHRIPGSVGCSAWPSRIIKGKKMPGHYGMAKQLVRNLEVVEIRPEENLLMVKGAVPGPVSGFVKVSKLKYLKDRK